MQIEAIAQKLVDHDARLPSHPLIFTLGYTPANRWDLLEKTSGKVTGGAWAFDLETATGPSEAMKQVGRDNIARALWTLDLSSNAQFFVRVNPVGSEAFRRDVSSLAVGRPDGITTERKRPHALSGIVVPKLSDVSELKAADTSIEELERALDLDRGSLSLVPIIESGAGWNNLGEIVAASLDLERVGYLAYGQEDLRQDLGVQVGEFGDRAMNDRRSRFIDHVGPTTLQAVDRVFTAFRDMEGLRRDAMEGRQLGYRAKMVISPNQVQPVLDGYRPDKVQLSHASQVVTEYELALSNGEGVATLDGKMIEKQHYLEALDLLLFALLLEVHGRTN